MVQGAQRPGCASPGDLGQVPSLLRPARGRTTEDAARGLAQAAAPRFCMEGLTSCPSPPAGCPADSPPCYASCQPSGPLTLRRDLRAGGDRAAALCARTGGTGVPEGRPSLSLGVSLGVPGRPLPLLSAPCGGGVWAYLGAPPLCPDGSVTWVSQVISLGDTSSLEKKWSQSPVYCD